MRASNRRASITSWDSSVAPPLSKKSMRFWRISRRWGNCSRIRWPMLLPLGVGEAASPSDYPKTKSSSSLIMQPISQVASSFFLCHFLQKIMAMLFPLGVVQPVSQYMLQKHEERSIYFYFYLSRKTNRKEQRDSWLSLSLSFSFSLSLSLSL